MGIKTIYEVFDEESEFSGPRTPTLSLDEVFQENVPCKNLKNIFFHVFFSLLVFFIVHRVIQGPLPGRMGRRAHVTNRRDVHGSRPAASSAAERDAPHPPGRLRRFMLRGSGWSPPPMGFYLGILTKWSPPQGVVHKIQILIRDLLQEIPQQIFGEKMGGGSGGPRTPYVFSMCSFTFYFSNCVVLCYFFLLLHDFFLLFRWCLHLMLSFLGVSE